MKLHDLKPAAGAHHERKRIGRGHGSGKVKTAGKGMGGQKARSGPNPYRTFEGGQNRMVRRMPYLRGFKNKWRIEYQVLNVADLSDLPDGHTVALEDLIVSGAINKNRPLKILGDGELSVKLTVEAQTVSGSARSMIESPACSVVVFPSVVERRSRSAGPNPAMRNRGKREQEAGSGE
jgi:large subunit ribosomal protein L15